MYWEDFYGQDTDTFEFIGTDDFKLKLEDYENLEDALTEIERCCGKHCRVKLFKEQ